MNRKLIRPSLSKMREQGKNQSKGKKRPPEKTGAEEFYYLKQMEARTPIVVRLADGNTIHGVLEWYDRDCIKVHRQDAPNLLIRKQFVQLIYKNEAAAEDPSDLKLVREKDG